MADNSYELFFPPYLNHPRTCPKNTTPYLPEVLSSSQQSKTDNAKIKMARDNQKYLGAHPEIKAIVSLILRNLFIHRPINIHEFVGEFVRRKDFSTEIAQFLIEHATFQMPEEEDEEDRSPKSTESAESVPIEDLDSTPGQGDRKFLKKMLYGADPQSLRYSTQSSTHSQLVLSYDRLLKMMRSSTCSAMHNMEESTQSTTREATLEEGDEEEEGEEDAESWGDEEDNEEALLAGQRLIFAMLGKKMTPSSSGSDISMLKTASKSTKKRVTLTYGEHEESSGARGSRGRASLYTGGEGGEQPSSIGEVDEDEEYFEKD